VFEFVFRLGLMGFQFLVLQVVPDLFVRIPVGRVFRQVEHMKARLLSDEGSGFLRGVRWRLIHDDNQVAARVMSQHLLEKVDNFG